MAGRRSITITTGSYGRCSTSSRSAIDESNRWIQFFLDNNNNNNNIVGVNAVGTIEDVFINNGIVVVDAEDSCSESQMKDRIEAEIVRIKEEAEKKKKEELLARRNEIRRLLQGHSVSISSLKLKCEKETQVIRHEENRMAIPEGNEDEEESDDEDDNDQVEDENNDNDSNDDSIKKTTTSLSNDSLRTTNPDDSDSEDDSDSDGNDDTESGNRQLERKLEKRRRRKVFHRVKRFVVGRKSVRY
mmetsp:Transcript_11568/g.12672  ORF Transcript_11568/g.12672 Transcript_11568/m.12672 type:complete len:244 (+) Transcript_11568:529-1260(+)